MFVPFETILEDARIWIYQADRSFDAPEDEIINRQGEAFLNAWAAHGQPLRASICTKHQHFVIIAVDDAAQLPTGCSIDQSVGFIRSLETQLGIGFFNRTKVSVWQNNSVLLKDIDTIKQEIQTGSVAADTLIFNNLITSKAQLEHWIVPIKASWLARYFTQTAGNLGS